MAYKPGEYLSICDICGFRGHSSEMRMTWNNLWVHASTCYDPKHPQFRQPSGLHEKQKVEISRPEQTDTFITDANDGDAWDAKTDAITGDDL